LSLRGEVWVYKFNLTPPLFILKCMYQARKVSVSCFNIRFWNCSDSVVFFAFLFICTYETEIQSQVPMHDDNSCYIFITTLFRITPIWTMQITNKRTRSLVLYVCFVDRCLSFCTFSFGHCVVCTSSINWFWLPPFGIFKLFLYNKTIRHQNTISSIKHILRWYKDL